MSLIDVALHSLPMGTPEQRSNGEIEKVLNAIPSWFQYPAVSTSA